MLHISKIDEDNINDYYAKVSATMYQEYCQTYNISDENKYELYFNHIREYILQHTYVLLWNTKLLGYFSLSPRDLNEAPTLLLIVLRTLYNYIKQTKTYYLFDVFVFPKYRNKGIGEYLVKQAIFIAKSQCATTLKLYTITSHLVSFYNKNGFEYSGCKNMNGRWMMLLEKKLI